LLDRTAALSLGGFDEGYMFGWGEDAELPLRARLAGWQCLHVPRACALHVDRPRGKGRAQAQFYNRVRMILTQYDSRTLMLLAPMLLAVEAMLLAASIAMGVADCWLGGWRAVWRDRRAIHRR